MLKIDIHTHIVPKHIPAFKKQFGYGGFVEIVHQNPGCACMKFDDGKRFRDITANCWDPQHRLYDCEADQVSVQVLSSVPVMFCYWAEPKDGLVVAQYVNDYIADVVAQNPRRFVGLATLPMQDPDLAIAELERAVKTLGLRGAEIGSHVGEWDLSAPELFPVFQAAERLDVCLFVHPWDMMGKNEMLKYWLPWLVAMPAETARAICSMIFGGVFERLPKLRVAFAHGGGSFPATIGRIAHGFEARPDLCAVDNPVSPREYLGNFYLDSLVYDCNAFELMLQVVGAERIALGSDYPFPLGERPVGALVESMDLDEHTLRRIFHESALEWLGMSAQDFL